MPVQASSVTTLRTYSTAISTILLKPSYSAPRRRRQRHERGSGGFQSLHYTILASLLKFTAVLCQLQHAHSRITIVPDIVGRRRIQGTDHFAVYADSDGLSPLQWQACR